MSRNIYTEYLNSLNQIQLGHFRSLLQAHNNNSPVRALSCWSFVFMRQSIGQRVNYGVVSSEYKITGSSQAMNKTNANQHGNLNGRVNTQIRVLRPPTTVNRDMILNKAQRTTHLYIFKIEDQGENYVWISEFSEINSILLSQQASLQRKQVQGAILYMLRYVHCTDKHTMPTIEMLITVKCSQNTRGAICLAFCSLNHSG